MIENENGDYVLAIKEPCLYDDKMASKNMKNIYEGALYICSRIGHLLVLGGI